MSDCANPNDNFSVHYFLYNPLIYYIRKNNIYLVMKNLFLLCLCWYCTSLSAQKDPIRWGKVNQAAIDLESVPYDSSASAVVLCDFGRIYASIGGGVTFRRHIRIKILNESAKGLADIAIPYYHKDGNEKISSFVAQTINVENNKPKKSELKKKEFFRVKVDENWSELRFSLPNVQVGSIIEYAYSTESNNYTNLESWTFQNEHPTLRSYLQVTIDGGLDYSILLQGSQLTKKYNGKPANIWELSNLPAIKDEPFCPNGFDFTEKIKFQLAAYQVNGRYETVMKTWKSVAGDLYSDGGIKQYLKQNKDAASIVETIVNPEDSDEVKVQKIYDHVVNKYEWNRQYRMMPVELYKNFKANQTGNSAEINLFFINLIQSAGLEATPALVSTKRHGFVARNITFYSQFNHLLACVRLNEKEILIDATNPYRPYDLLDSEDLNREALVLHKKEPYWIPVPINKQTKKVKLITMEIPEPGTVKYKYEVNGKAYEALDIREDLQGESSEEKIKDYYNRYMIRENTEYEISNITTKGLDKDDKAIYLSAEIQDNTSSTVNDDFIYINPFIDQYVESNPFNDKERYLPVDFYYPFEEMYILNLQIPEGYEVIEYPEAVNLTTEGNKGKLQLTGSLKEDKLQIRVIFSIKNPFFTPYEYPILREIFDRYIEKREEQIVLKKKA